MSIGSRITTEAYGQLLEEKMKKFLIKRPRLVNRGKPHLLFDNVRPHASRITAEKMYKSQLVAL